MCPASLPCPKHVPFDAVSSWYELGQRETERHRHGTTDLGSAFLGDWLDGQRLLEGTLVAAPGTGSVRLRQEATPSAHRLRVGPAHSTGPVLVEPPIDGLADDPLDAILEVNRLPCGWRPRSTPSLDDHGGVRCEPAAVRRPPGRGDASMCSSSRRATSPSSSEALGLGSRAGASVWVGSRGTPPAPAT